MAEKVLTVRELMKQLTEMKKLGLADATVILEGCDCIRLGTSVEKAEWDGKKAVLVKSY